MLTWFRGLPAAIRAARRFYRDLAVAVQTFVLGAGIYLAGFAPLTASSAEPVLWQRMTLFGLACAAMLLRSRATLVWAGIALVLVGVDFALGFTLPMVFVLADAIFSLVLYTSRRASRVAAAVILLAGIAVAIALSAGLHDWRTIFVRCLQVFTIALIPLWWALEVRTQADVAVAERERAKLDRKAAIDAERGRMARDLHDVIAAHLSSIAVHSEAALTTERPELMRRALTAIRTDSVTALEEMRAMIGLLRSGEDSEEPSPRAPHGLAELDGLLESARASGVRVEADVRLPELPAAVDLAAYRILKEALANAVRHAPELPVSLTALVRGDRLVLSVANPLPRAAGTSQGSGMGVANMTERASDLGGTARIGAEDGQWLVAVELPLHPVALGG